MIKQTMSQYDIANELMTDEYASWTYEAAMALAEWYEQLSEDIGEDVEFDRVAIRCGWNELSRRDFVRDYACLVERDMPSDPSWAANCEEFMEGFLENLRYQTTVIELDNGNLLVMGF